MAAQELDLIVDVQQGKVARSITSTAEARLPEFTVGDSTPIKARFVVPTGIQAAPWKDLDVTDEVRVAIGSLAARTVTGSYTLLYDGEETAPIAYSASAATISTAFNALASVIAAGGAAVTLASSGAYRIAFNTPGARGGITADTSSLYPSTAPFIAIARAGTETLSQVALVNLRAQPAAYQVLTKDDNSVAATVEVVEAGVAGADTVYSLDVDATVAAGRFALRVNGNQSSYDYNASPEVLAYGLSRFAIGAENVTVTGTAPSWEITFNSRAGEIVLAVDEASTAHTIDDGLVVVEKTQEWLPGTQAIQNFDLPAITEGDPASAFYRISFLGKTTTAIPYNADESSVEAKLAAIGALGTKVFTRFDFDTIGGVTVMVRSLLPRFKVFFDPTLGEVDPITIDTSGIPVPLTFSGSLNLATSGIAELLGAGAAAKAKFEIEIYNALTGTAWTVLQTDCNLRGEIIGSTPSAQAGGPTYLTAEGRTVTLSIYNYSGAGVEVNGISCPDDETTLIGEVDPLAIEFFSEDGAGINGQSDGVIDCGAASGTSLGNGTFALPFVTRPGSNVTLSIGGI